jgi:transposase
METRIIGIDLAVKAAHRGAVLDQGTNSLVGGLFEFRSYPAHLDRVLDRARSGASADVEVKAVLEATGMAWYPVSTYLDRHGVTVYRVNGQKTADLRKLYNPHSKNDRLDARVLARLPLVAPESLDCLWIPTGEQQALQRACREAEQLTELVAASKNRVQAIDDWAWLGWPLDAPYGSRARWLRRQWYNPWRVCSAGVEAIADAWRKAHRNHQGDLDWLDPLLQRAEQVTELYGSPQQVAYERLQAYVTRQQERWQRFAAARHRLRLERVRPLYRRLCPHRHLESLRGVGQDSAAVYVAFIGNVRRFPSLRRFRGWSGLVPYSRQSGQRQASGLRITQAGPDLIKTTAYRNAEVARQWDPQIAAIYHRQMMAYGKHHKQAVCTCATHLLNRIYAVLRDQRPYELRDTDGTPVSKRRARQICVTRYQVPDHVRRRNNHNANQRRR